ncbi:flagellar basal body-associated protein FliL [Natranaerovirga pectinivora]|uniref:Flagellar protein FliL n=1 Tax=Natranaerovirga pectinivora TaxID=682400 RepID=A0A4R3MPG3_9FIRM|nr:flagellar basal body-associated FliL family protein [Natranaerovirga pectinivora]TCT16432.1 flagellar basal body-associated protein FliL [Natranaerovirga pectinivora]
MEKGKILLPIGIALLVVNLILTTLLIILALPPLTRVNKIVTTMEQVLDLELINEDTVGNIPIEDLEIIMIDDQISVNARSITTNKNHVLRFSVGFTINKKDKDSKRIMTLMAEQEQYIIAQIRSAASFKTYEEVITNVGTKELGKDIANHLNEVLNTNVIVETIFREYIYN